MDKEETKNEAGPRVSGRLIAVVAVVVVAFVVGITVWATSGGKQAAPSFVDYKTLFQDAEVHVTTISVLNQWPKPPYQTYTSGKDQCFEWYEAQAALYNLCFKNGVLDSKDLE